MPEPERRRLEHVADAGVHVELVARVLGQFFAQKRGNVLVRDDVLRGRKQRSKPKKTVRAKSGRVVSAKRRDVIVG